MSISRAKGLNIQTENMETAGVPEMTAPNHFHTLRNSPEERRINSGINPFWITLWGTGYLRKIFPVYTEWKTTDSYLGEI